MYVLSGHRLYFPHKTVFLLLKIVFVIATIVGPDEMPHYVAFHLGLYCLSKKQLMYESLVNKLLKCQQYGIFDENYTVTVCKLSYLTSFIINLIFVLKDINPLNVLYLLFYSHPKLCFVTKYSSHQRWPSTYRKGKNVFLLFLKPLKPSGLCNHYQLDLSTSILRFVGWHFYFLFKYE